MELEDLTEEAEIPVAGERALPGMEELPMHLLGDHPAEQYCRDVLSGAILACRYVKLAVIRHIRDLEHGHERGLWFDREAAERRIEFYRFCRHYEGEWDGKVMEPAPFQQFIHWCIYGWKNADGTRRFHMVYETMARKNGKSTDKASDGVHTAFFDGEPGAQVYTAATKKDQAKIIHRCSTRMVEKSPALRKRIRVFKNNLHNEETASRYEPLGQDSNTEDGLNVHAAFIDEYHAHPDAGMLNVLKNGTGSRRNWLIWIVTTAGFDKGSACFEEQEYAIGILEGIFEDDAYFAIVYTLDEEDKENWLDERVWIKANPNLGVTPKLENMRVLALEASRKTSARNDFLVKRLNLWTETTTTWITSDAWDKCGGEVNAEWLGGAKCFGALDLSSTIDISAWAKCFPPENAREPFRFLWKFFVPAEDLKQRFPNAQVHSQIRNWIRLGYITTTPGNVIDYDFVRAAILEDAEQYSIEEIAYDPYNASQLVNDLQKENLTLVEFRQGFLTMSPAAKDFEQKALSGLLAHGGNPVIRWMLSCTEIATDPAGNIKPVKPDRGKSVKRIDGIVAAIMALDRAVKNNTNGEPGVEVW